MAKAELSIILDKMRGRFAGDSKFYTTNRYGRTVISNYPLHRDPKTITPHQRELNASFGQLSKQAKLEMSDPERLAYWQDRYDAYKKAANKNLARANAQLFGTTNGIPNVPADKYYKTLRGFIIAQLKILSKQ